MKKQLISTLAIAVFITTIAVVSVHAQSSSVVTVSIPFEFTVANKVLPAGEYQMRTEGSRSTLKIENRDTSHATFVTISPLQSADIQNESKLVFNRYGSQYFLAQVWVAGRSTGEEMRKSKQERAIRSELSALKRTAETVTIAARSN